MSLKLYADLVSQPSRAVFIFLKVNNIKFETKLIHIKKGDNLTPEYRAISPFGLVPAIDDAGFKLSESVAILRYLCKARNVADCWYPKDMKHQARVDEYLEWQHLNTRHQLMMYVQLKFLRPILNRGIASVKDIMKQKLLMEDSLDKIENHWLANSKPYLTGDSISIADILGACEVEQPRIAGYDPHVNRPNIAAWMTRVQNDLNPHYDEAHKILRIISEKFGGEPPSALR